MHNPSPFHQPLPYLPPQPFSGSDDKIHAKSNRRNSKQKQSPSQKQMPYGLAIALQLH